MISIVVTAPGLYQCLTNEEPEVGRGYFLEDSTTGTQAQNKAFHALVSEYWKSGMHSYPARDFGEFRDMIKRSLGAGFEKYVYAEIVNGKPVIREAKHFEDVPEAIRRDPDLKQLVRGRLKSWSDYTKNERTDTMGKLIAEMVQAGLNSRKFNEIIEGMDSDKGGRFKRLNDVSDAGLSQDFQA